MSELKVPDSIAELVILPKFGLLTKLLKSTPLGIACPLRLSRAPELARKTALAIELRAEVAVLITLPRSAVGSLRADSISVIAASTLRMAALVSGRPAAFARYSPISAESFASFLRFSSCCLAETSDVAMAPAVTPAKLVNSEVLSVKPVVSLAESKTGADKLEFGKT